MKSFNQFLTEADIKGNPAISPEYLQSLNKRAEASAREIEQKYGREMMELMRAVQAVQTMQRGHEKEIEALTKEVIMEKYGLILGETELDVKLGKPNAKLMGSDSEQDQDDEVEVKDIEDEDTKNAIYKRKIQNIIAQGEAINSKKMLMGDTNVSGLSEILGEENASKMVELLVKITDICNARDWRIPEEVAARMIEQGDAISGISKIEWKPKPPATPEEILDTAPEDLAASAEEEAEVAELTIYGLDQAMLFHEAVKAIIGLINQGGLAHLSDEIIAKVFLNTDTPGDEAQDLKRAKLVASDLRDFLLTFPEVSKMENGREYVWGKMIDASVLPDREFLELMRLIFISAPIYRESAADEYTESELAAANEAMPKAQVIVTRLIKLIKDELAEWEAQKNAGEIEDLDLPIQTDAKLSQSEIQDMIDAALDSGDIETVKKLSALLK